MTFTPQTSIEAAYMTVILGHTQKFMSQLTNEVPVGMPLREQYINSSTPLRVLMCLRSAGYSIPETLLPAHKVHRATITPANLP